MTRSEYDSYISATRTLFDWNTAQDRCSAVASHFVRYTRTLAITKARLSERQEVNAPGVSKQLNECVSAYLAAVRSFLDQSDEHLSRRFGKDSLERAAFKRATNAFYDNNFSYRLMDQLRNFTQHAGQAIQGISYGQAIDPRTGSETRTLNVSVKRNSLLNWRKLKASVREELQNHPQDLPITAYLRIHFNCIQPLHVVFTKQFAGDLRAAASFIVGLVEPLETSPGTAAVYDMAHTEGEFKEGDEFALAINRPVTDFARGVLNLLDRSPFYRGYS